ncbi:MAG: DUF6151 family protein [Pseudomonadota bacterium]
MEGPDTRFSCRCGALTGTMAGLTPQTGTRLVCHCEDCARALRHYGIDADTQTGVDLVQTTPDRIHIETGAENLGLARLSPKGLSRWYATCCGTPIFNTLSTPGLPFSTILTDRLEGTEAIGPALARVNKPPSMGKPASERIGKIVVSMLSRAAKARLSGRWRDTPFFDATTGQPVAEPELLPRDAGRL